MNGVHRRFPGKITEKNSGRLTKSATTAGAGRAIQRLIHDLADGAGAPAALGAATQATIDLPGRTGTDFRRDGGANIVVAQNIAGTNDHRRVLSGQLILERPAGCKKNRPFL